jgi:hypothetical protein
VCSGIIEGRARRSVRRRGHATGAGARERTPRSIDPPSRAAAAVAGAGEDGERLLPVLRVRGPGERGGGGEVRPLHPPRRSGPPLLQPLRR